MSEIQDRIKILRQKIENLSKDNDKLKTLLVSPINVCKKCGEYLGLLDEVECPNCDRLYKLTNQVKDTCTRAEKAESERDFFSKRDCNATVQLSYSTNDYPFNKEDLKIVDVGVSDNVYVVESKLFNSIQAERDRFREALKVIAKDKKFSPMCSTGRPTDCANFAIEALNLEKV